MLKSSEETKLIKILMNGIYMSISSIDIRHSDDLFSQSPQSFRFTGAVTPIFLQKLCLQTLNLYREFSSLFVDCLFRRLADDLEKVILPFFPISRFCWKLFVGEGFVEAGNSS